MSDKRKTFVAPTSKTRRPSTVSVIASSSRSKVPASTTKEKNVVSRTNNQKINKNASVLGSGDMTMLKQDVGLPDFEVENRQIAYGKFLRAMLEDCLVDEKIEREETEMDIQMAQLADRFQKTMDQLSKTNRRLKDISFVVEQKRLLDLKNSDCTKFYEMSDSTNAKDLIRDLNTTEQACLDKLHTKNVDLGYNKETGHQQLLDAVNDALEGLEQIKLHSNLDINKFKEYTNSQISLEELERDRFELESLKSDFDAKFPKFSEKLLKEASEKIMRMVDNDDDDDEDEDDD